MKDSSIFRKVLGGEPGSVLIRLAIASVIVGAALSVTRIDPTMLWTDFFGAVAEAWSRFWRQGWTIVMWIGQYLALGAVIVLPIWAIYRVIKAVVPGGRSKGDDAL